jgi:secreted Zn-dependent insulinase-like peptidase
MYQKTVLKNGIRVASENIPHIRSISIGIWITTGSRHEDSEEKGISHFIEHLVFKGTKSRSALDIAKEIDSVGGILNGFTEKEYTCFHAKVLDQHCPLAIELLSDILLHSIFDPSEIERERNAISMTCLTRSFGEGIPWGIPSWERRSRSVPSIERRFAATSMITIDQTVSLYPWLAVLTTMR